MGRVAAGSSATTGAGAAEAGRGFDAAHGALATDKSLQFAIEAPKPPPPPPDWLKDLFEILANLGPLFKIIFWVGLAVVVVAILWVIGRELIRIRMPERHTPNLPGAEDWRPAPAQAMALLSDADALAEQGLYAEAVHLILLRSIGDIDGRLPNTVRPALTSRDIAALHRLPDAARPAFNSIARVVEASLFGGQAVMREEFAECRRAYEAFAFPDAWSAA
jgi:hypothetical protein